MDWDLTLNGIQAGYMILWNICRWIRYLGTHHDELTLSMVYAYSENFILALSHDELFLGHADFMERMPGDGECERAANMKALLGFQTAHPGKKAFGDGTGQTGCLHEGFIKVIS